MKRSGFYLEVSSLLLVDPSLSFSASSCIYRQSTKQNSGSSYCLSLLAFLSFLPFSSLQYTYNPFLLRFEFPWGIRTSAELEACFWYIQLSYLQRHTFFNSYNISGPSLATSSQHLGHCTCRLAVKAAPTQLTRNYSILYCHTFCCSVPLRFLTTNRVHLASSAVVSGIHNAATHTIRLTLVNRYSSARFL